MNILNTPPEPFGVWVRRQRQARELTQAECARRAGMKPQQWNRMETTVKEPLLKTAESVALGLAIF